MTPTQKLELDPYFSTRKYLNDVLNYLEEGKLKEAEKIIEDAKNFDINYYQGEFPNYEEVALMHLETGNLKEAKRIFQDAQKNSPEFYKRAYLELININKKIGEEKENKKIILEAMNKDRDSFLNYGYKKLIEILVDEKKYQSALKVIEAARMFQISQMEDFRLISFNSLPEIRKINFFPDVEDYQLKIKIQEKLRVNSNN